MQDRAEKYRLKPLRLESVRQRVHDHIQWSEQELAGPDQGLDRTVGESLLRREKDNLWRSVSGIGPLVSITPLSDLPELGP